MYLAKVKFPSEGSWTYQVWDGFGQTHSFAAVQIGAGSGDGGFSIPDWTWALAAAAAGLIDPPPGARAGLARPRLRSRSPRFGGAASSSARRPLNSR